ncbi:MAG: T9SS type A sorting domain-containing protein [Bacteroidia bacterium]
MKKTSILIGLMTAGLFASAQTRMALYEEFTGENCGPCAATNPGLNTLLSANASKVIAIKWQVPIPSAPTPTWSLYKTDMADIDARWKAAPNGYGYPESTSSPTAAYINSAPNGRMNGEQLNVYGVTGTSYNHPANLTSAAISSAQALPTPFSVNMNVTYDATYSNAVVTVTVTSSSTFTSVGSLVYRLVLVERQVNFATAPGTNGEKDFYDPVRKVYPGAGGTALTGTWTASQTQTLSINCAIPSYINDKTQMAFVGFIQDDGSKKIWQAARTASVGALPNDIKAVAVAVNGFACGSSITPSLAVLNQGNTAITAMTITPSIDGVAQTPFTYNGNIAAGATATIALNSYAATGGNHNVVLNVTGVSGGDINTANNSSAASAALVQTYFAGPVTQAFASATFPPTNWFKINADNGAATWIWNGTAGFNGAGAAKYDFYNNANIGDADELYLPPTNLSGVSSPVLSFDVAYAQYSNENDQLDVEVSTDCGATWSNIYSKAGSVLATVAAQTSAFTASSAGQWRHEAVAVPMAANNASVLVKFVATTDYGNNMYIDNVNLGAAVSIAKSSSTASGFDVYPNPSKGETTIAITSATAGSAKITVINTLGQIVYTKEVNLNLGANSFQFDTKDLASGIYNVVVDANSTSSVKKLTVTK